MSKLRGRNKKYYHVYVYHAHDEVVDSVRNRRTASLGNEKTRIFLMAFIICQVVPIGNAGNASHAPENNNDGVRGWVGD